MRRFEIRLSGTGGQGLILAGQILAEAAISDGLNAVQTQSYGPEARGGASKAEVIVAEEEIDYPKVVRPHVLLAMSQEACDRYAGTLADDGILVVDSGWVDSVPRNGVRTYLVPLTELARQETGKSFVANIVALGFLAGLTGVVSRESLETAVLRRVPRGTEALNARALRAGYRAAAELSPVQAETPSTNSMAGR